MVAIIVVAYLSDSYSAIIGMLLSWIPSVEVIAPLINAYGFDSPPIWVFNLTLSIMFFSVVAASAHTCTNYKNKTIHLMKLSPIVISILVVMIVFLCTFINVLIIANNSYEEIEHQMKAGRIILVMMFISYIFMFYADAFGSKRKSLVSEPG